MTMSSPRHRESGNVFFAIFGAVAIVGLLGAGLATFVRGPLSSSVTVTRQSVAENQMVIGAQTAIMSASSQAGLGDCDGDMFVEAIPWRDRGALPAPTNGGLIPGSIAAPKRDPWGVDYGYCVWDHGPTVDDAACGGPTQRRLEGTNSAAYPVLAIVSAGPDRAFQTTCADWSVADANADGDLLDAGDTNLIYKLASSDDLIFTYSYEQAVASSGDMWSLKSSDPNVATLAKNLEVTGGASFTSTGDFVGITGDTVRAYTSGGFIDSDPFRLPDSSTFNPTCNAGLTGVLRTNMSGAGGSGGGGGGATMPSLNLGVEVSSAAVNLTSLNYDDWAVWNDDGNLNPDNRKAGGGAIIPNPTLYGQNFLGEYHNSTRTISYTDGTSPASSSQISGIYNYAGAIGDGFQIALPADTQMRVAKIYFQSANAAAINITATMSDGSSPPQTYTGFPDASGTERVGVMTIAYRAGSAGQTMTVHWELAALGPSYNNVTLDAVALDIVPAGTGVTVAPTTTYRTAATNTASGTTLTTPAFDSTGFEGIAVFAKHQGAITSIDITDSVGTSFAPLTKVAHSGNSLYGQIFWANLGATSATHTVTMTLGAGRTYRDVVVWLINADGTTIALEDSQGSGSSAATYPYIDGLTTTVPTAIVAGVGGSANQNYWPMDGWTEDGKNSRMIAIHRDASDAGHFQPGVTSDNGVNSVFAAAAFKDATAAYTPPVTGSSIALEQKSTLTMTEGLSSATITMPAPSTAGNTIIIPMKIWGGQVSGVTDNLGNTYTDVAWSHTGQDETSAIWYANNITANGSPIVITMTISGAAQRRFAGGALEFSGISDAGNPVEQTGTLANLSGGASSTVATSSAKVAQGQLSVAVLALEYQTNQNLVHDPDWTLAYQTNDPAINYNKRAISAVYKIAAETGAESHTWTHVAPIDSNTESVASIATFLPASFTVPGCDDEDDGSGGGGAPAVVPTFIASTSGTGAAGTMTINKPAGTLDGHVMVMAVSGDNGQNLPITWPAGWTELQKVDIQPTDGHGWGMAYKVAGSEPASYNITYSGASGLAGVIATYSGVDTSNPIADHDEAHANSGNDPWTVIGPNLTTTIDNTRIVWFGVIDTHQATTGVSFTPPTGYTERHDFMGGTNWTFLAMADGVQATAGATGPVNGAAIDTSNVTAATTGAMAVALQPSGTPVNPIQFVQQTTHTVGATRSLAGTVPGNTIVVPISVWNGTVTNVTDTAGNTYVKVAESVQNISRNYIYVANNITGGATTITVSTSGGERNWGAAEFSGLANFSLVDETGQSNVAGGGAPTVATSGPTTNDFELAIVLNQAAYSNNNLNYAVEPGWTALFTQNDAGCCSGHSSAYKILDTAQLVTHVWDHETPIDGYNDNTSLIVTLRATSGESITCPAGYTMHADKCYKFDAAPRSWSAAQTMCQADGGEMLVINDEAERAYIATQGYYQSWVGYNRSSGSWVWNTPSSWESTVNRQCVETIEDTWVGFTAPAGNTITGVDFASYGTPTGVCGGYSTTACHAANSVSYTQSQCVGNTTCGFNASNPTFGGDPCSGTIKSMFVQIRDSSTVWGAGEPNESSNCATIWQDSVPGFRLADTPCNSGSVSTICEAEPVYAGGGGGSVTPLSIGVQAPGVSGGDPTVTSTFATNPTAGSSIVVPISSFGRLWHVSDNAGNSYASVADINEGTSRSSIHVATNIKLPPSGNLAVTAHFQQYEGGTMRPFEVIGLNPVDFLDRIGMFSTASGGATTTVTASAANTQADELAVGVVYPLYSRNPMAPFSVAGGWTQNYVEANCQGSVCHSSAYKILSATETTSHTWTHQAPVDANNDGSAVVATLKRNDAGATPNPYIVRVSTMGFGIGASNSMATTFATPPAAGNAIIVFVVNETASNNWGVLNTGDVTDNQGNTYVKITGTITGLDWTNNVHMFAAYNVASSGTFTVTATYPGGVQSGRIGAVEVTGLLANGADATGTNFVNYSGPSNTVSTSTPTSTANTLAIAMIGDYVGRVHTKQPGWSFIYNEADNGQQALSIVAKTISTASTVSHTFGHENGVPSSAAIATFRLSGSSGGGSGGGGSCGGNNLLQMCNGAGAWVGIGGGGGTNPINEGNFDPSTSSVCNTAATGNVRYNASASRPEFCNGTAWAPFFLTQSGASLVATPTHASLTVTGPVITPPDKWGDPVTITVTNVGSEASDPLSLSLNGGMFIIDGGMSTCLGLALQPGASCTANVHMVAGANGTSEDVLNIETGGPVRVDVPLRGVATQFTTCEPGVRGWGGIVLSCVDSTTPDYILQEPGCGTGTSEPACSGDGSNDGIFSMTEGYTYSERLRQDMVNINLGMMYGDQNSVSTIGYGATAPAAVYCNALVKGTYTNWYLPSAQEVELYVRPNWDLLGMYWDSGVYYWTSSVAWYDGVSAYFKRYNYATTDQNDYGSNWRVRCMRRHGAATPSIMPDTTPYLWNAAVYPFTPNYTTSLSTVVASNAFRVLGINTPQAVTVTGAGTPQFRINGGAWGTSGNVSPNQTVEVRATSPASVGQERVIMVNIGQTTTVPWMIRTVQAKTVKIFVTSTTYNGNLGGLAGADAICQTRAAAGSQTNSGVLGAGSWYAILASTDVLPMSRIPWNWNRAERIGATTVVASNVMGLYGGIGTAVNRDENGTTRNNPVWTGMTNSEFLSPTWANTNCADWTNNTAGYAGYTGAANLTTTGWLADNTPTCNNTRRLYCIGPF